MGPPGSDGSCGAPRSQISPPSALRSSARLVSSGAGLGGFYLASLYCASKAAVVGFAKSMGMADEEEGVKVVCICPG